ncbi:hypothetical protein C8R45DRAFT_946545 [Mycena sanguinolenta]|nr:hypothetical protein C8R45DRAFT_946545 [Mycena sanguinolenta]
MSSRSARPTTQLRRALWSSSVKAPTANSIQTIRRTVFFLPAIKDATNTIHFPSNTVCFNQLRTSIDSVLNAPATSPVAGGSTAMYLDVRFSFALCRIHNEYVKVMMVRRLTVKLNFDPTLIILSKPGDAQTPTLRSAKPASFTTLVLNRQTAIRTEFPAFNVREGRESLVAIGSPSSAAPFAFSGNPGSSLDGATRESSESEYQGQWRPQPPGWKVQSTSRPAFRSWHN